MKIENCTAVFKLLPRKLRFSHENFIQLARFGINTEYNPKRFHSIIMRLRLKENRTTAALIFESSKVVLTGVPTPELARKLAWKVTKRILASYRAAGNDNSSIGLRNLRVTNIVGVYRHPQRLAIEQLYKQLRNNNDFRQVFYDPTIFPALRFKLKEAACLCYISGRVILTGIKTEEQMKEIFENLLLPLFEKYTRK
uniref:Uncharacterized protein n=2 Tax=Meloidogyne TaxID=189290 RepID=A0A6V7WDD8_MELEN|nr:unnamed protein product [Meloidogyne enterolobii]CAD2184989.1 unnamed protein product [Meloidogyne enterolobii]